MVEFVIRPGNIATGVATVEHTHFGAIYSTYFGFEAFLRQSASIGVTDLRWPGGTRGELARDEFDKDGDGDTDEYLFGLEHDDLTVIGHKGLSKMIAHASDSGIDLSIFIPSLRYVSDPEAAFRDAYHFTTKLLLEEKGGFGMLPNQLTIELGNESLDGSVEAAVAYGAVANAQLSGIYSALTDAGLKGHGRISIAMQIGRSAEEDAAIRDMIDTPNLRLVDALVSHHLPINIRNHNKILDSNSELDWGDSRFTRTKDYIEQWSSAVSSARGDFYKELDHLSSAWTVGPSSDFPEVDLNFQDIGARQARTTIDTFVQLIGAGADSAYLWGVDARSNPNFFTRMEGGDTEISHGGEAFRMMAESLVGSTLHAGYTQATDLDGHPSQPGWVYTFESEEAFILFVVANDIDRPTEIQIALAGEAIDFARPVDAQRLSTRVDDESHCQDRRDERPTVSNSEFYLSDSEFEFMLTQDFEVNRLTIWKAPESASDFARGPHSLNMVAICDFPEWRYPEAIYGSDDEFLL